MPVIRQHAGTEVEKFPSYDNILVLEHVLDGGEKQYIPECLYSHHEKHQFSLRDTEMFIRVLSGICFIYFKAMHPPQNALRTI